MNKNVILLITSILIFSILNTSFGQQSSRPNADQVHWYTIEQAIQLSKKSHRKIFIDVYTDWCGWCKHMDKETFQLPHIAKYLNNNFYPVRFNAEQKEDIIFNGKTYHFVPSGRSGYHELAAELLGGKLSYPTVVFLDENMNLIQAIPGYKEPTVFELIMTYFGDNGYKSTPWTKYERDYKPMDNTIPIKNGN